MKNTKRQYVVVVFFLASCGQHQNHEEGEVKCTWNCAAQNINYIEQQQQQGTSYYEQYLRNQALQNANEQRRKKNAQTATSDAERMQAEQLDRLARQRAQSSANIPDLMN